MRNDFESNYLMHHGILGQKYGVRNGPPYPLDAKDHSASEKKAGYKKSIGGGRNEELYDKNQTKKKKNKYQNADGSLTKKATKKLLKNAKYDKQKEDIKRYSKMSSEEFEKELKRTKSVQEKTMADSLKKSRSRAEQIAKNALAEQAFNDHVKMLVYKKSVEQLLEKNGKKKIS